jgi:hypothetical protein
MHLAKVSLKSSYDAHLHIPGAAGVAGKATDSSALASRDDWTVTRFCPTG